MCFAKFLFSNGEIAESGGKRLKGAMKWRGKNRSVGKVVLWAPDLDGSGAFLWDENPKVEGRVK